MHLVINNIYHIQVPWENYVPSTYDYGKWLKIRFFLDNGHERMEKKALPKHLLSYLALEKKRQPEVF